MHIKEKVVTKSTLVTMHYLLVASLKGNAYFSKAAAFSYRFAWNFRVIVSASKEKYSTQTKIFLPRDITQTILLQMIRDWYISIFQEEFMV